MCLNKRLPMCPVRSSDFDTAAASVSRSTSPTISHVIGSRVALAELRQGDDWAARRSAAQLRIYEAACRGSKIISDVASEVCPGWLSKHFHRCLLVNPFDIQLSKPSLRIAAADHGSTT